MEEIIQRLRVKFANEGINIAIYDSNIYGPLDDYQFCGMAALQYNSECIMDDLTSLSQTLMEIYKGDFAIDPDLNVYYNVKFITITENYVNATRDIVGNNSIAITAYGKRVN